MSTNLANSLEFFYFKDGINLQKFTFKNCDQSVCRDKNKKISIIFHCGNKECRGTVAHENIDYFIIDEQGRVFIYNKLDKEGNQIPFVDRFIEVD